MRAALSLRYDKLRIAALVAALRGRREHRRVWAIGQNEACVSFERFSPRKSASRLRDPSPPEGGSFGLFASL